MASKKMMIRSAAAICAVALAMPFAARAVPLTWAVDATYTNGFAATGTFVYDASLGAAGFGLISVDLSGPGGPFVLDTLTDCGGANQNGPNGFTFATDTVCNGPAIQVRGLPFAMTDAGGVISIAQADVSLQSIACSVNCDQSGTAQDGSHIAAVSEPATLGILGMGLLALGLRRKRA